MRIQRQRIVGIVALLLAAGCGVPEPRVQPGAPALDASSERASELLAECRRRTGDAATACYDSALLANLSSEGVRSTMAVLERIGELDPEVKRQGHLFAHSIGLAALESPTEVATTFAQCTEVFQSGCYHGVIQAYFAVMSSSTGQQAGVEAVNALCEAYRTDPSSRWLFFQCAHGMGHGLTGFYGHDLRAALGGCDLLRDDWEREACYGGAFMENVVQATAPHHSVGRPEMTSGAEEHAEHDHAAMVAAASTPPADEHAQHTGVASTTTPFKALDPADPLYPCNALDVKYQFSCYHMQTSAILFFNGGDVPATARACHDAPDAYRGACFQSLGRDISAYTQQNHQRANRLCSDITSPYDNWCHVGYAKNLVDLTADAADGMAYCRLLTAAASKTACYTAIGEQTWVLSDDPAMRREWCEGAEQAFRAACSVGAGLAREATSPASP